MLSKESITCTHKKPSQIPSHIYIYIYIYILQYGSTKNNQVNNFKSEQKKQRIHFDQATCFFYFFIYGVRT